MNFNGRENRNLPSFGGALTPQYPNRDGIQRIGGAGLTGTGGEDLPTTPRPDLLQTREINGNLSAQSPVNFVGTLNGRRVNSGAAGMLLWGSGIPMNLNPTVPLQRRVAPAPSTSMLLATNVDTPVRRPEQTINYFLNSSPPLSQSSTESSCSCNNCRGCLCHLYCEYHARIECPVHGDANSSCGGRTSRSSAGSASECSILGFTNSDSGRSHSSPSSISSGRSEYSV